MSLKINLEIGHEAVLRVKNTPEGFTHDWKIFVRGFDGANIHHYVEKVVFYLHETFQKPKRVIKEPPYFVKESGYAGFIIPIEIYLRTNGEPKKIKFSYDLSLQRTGPPLRKVTREKYVFTSPPDDLRDKLIKGGATVPGNSPESNENKSVLHEEKNQLISKPKLNGEPPSKKPKLDHPPWSNSFQDLFGTPITKTSKPPEPKPTVPPPKENKSTSKLDKEKNNDKSKSKHNTHKDKEKERTERKEKKEEKKKEKRDKDRERNKDKSLKVDEQLKLGPSSPKEPTPKLNSPAPHSSEGLLDKQRERDAKSDKDKKEKRREEERKIRKEKREKDRDKYRENNKGETKNKEKRIKDISSQATDSVTTTSRNEVSSSHLEASTAPSQATSHPGPSSSQNSSSTSRLPTDSRGFDSKHDKKDDTRPEKKDKSEEKKHKHKKKDKKRVRKDEVEKKTKTPEKQESGRSLDVPSASNIPGSPPSEREVIETNDPIVTSPQPAPSTSNNRDCRYPDCGGIISQPRPAASEGYTDSSPTSSRFGELDSDHFVDYMEADVLFMPSLIKHLSEGGSEGIEMIGRTDFLLENQDSTPKSAQEEPENINLPYITVDPVTGQQTEHYQMAENEYNMLTGLKNRISELRNGTRMLERVIDIVYSSGNYEVTDTFDFNLSELDQDTIAKLMEVLPPDAQPPYDELPEDTTSSPDTRSPAESPRQLESPSPIESSSSTPPHSRSTSRSPPPSPT